MRSNGKIPRDLLTMMDLMFIFDTWLTPLYAWRKDHDLPFYEIPGSVAAEKPVRFSWGEVREWAAKNEKKIFRSPTVRADGTVAWTGRHAKAFKKFKEDRRGYLSYQTAKWRNKRKGRSQNVA